MGERMRIRSISDAREKRGERDCDYNNNKNMTSCGSGAVAEELCHRRQERMESVSQSASRRGGKLTGRVSIPQTFTNHGQSIDIEKRWPLDR